MASDSEGKKGLFFKIVTCVGVREKGILYPWTHESKRGSDVNCFHSLEYRHNRPAGLRTVTFNVFSTNSCCAVVDDPISADPTNANAVWTDVWCSSGNEIADDDADSFSVHPGGLVSVWVEDGSFLTASVFSV